MTHMQDSFRKSLSTAMFERKLSSVSLPLLTRFRFRRFSSTFVVQFSVSFNIFSLFGLTSYTQTSSVHQWWFSMLL